jgi:hypothetical protein
VTILGFNRLAHSAAHLAQYLFHAQAISLGQFDDLLFGLGFSSDSRRLISFSTSLFKQPAR